MEAPFDGLLLLLIRVPGEEKERALGMRLPPHSSGKNTISKEAVGPSARDLQAFSRVLPTSRVGYHTGKPIESVVYCLNSPYMAVPPPPFPPGSPL